MRLITSGCSYTQHCWSTWADIIAYSFDDYKNLAFAGSDNASIARKVMISAQEFDIVIIMWSSFDRWSIYKDEVACLVSEDPLDQNTHWHHLGSAKNKSKDYFVNYYHPVERFQTTMDYVQLVDLHSKVYGYNVFHFSAFPLFLGEIEQSINEQVLTIYNDYRDQIRNNHLQEISLDEYTDLNKQRKVISHAYCNNDSHPLPLTHWEYAEKIIAPKLGISLKENVFPNIKQEHDNILNYGKLTYK